MIHPVHTREPLSLTPFQITLQSFLPLLNRIALFYTHSNFKRGTFIDTYSKVAIAKLYDRKNALVAADLLNDRVLPFFEEHEIPLLRILTDRGSEYCGNRQHHEYQLSLAVENIDHSKTKARSPQSNGICELFHKTVLDEFYRVAFRKKVYTSLEELQRDLDVWLKEYNEERTHSGKYCYGKTPMQTFIDSLPMTKEKLIGYNVQAVA
jgi:transposase InsO family protein